MIKKLSLTLILTKKSWPNRVMIIFNEQSSIKAQFLSLRWIMNDAELESAKIKKQEKMAVAKTSLPRYAFTDLNNNTTPHPSHSWNKVLC